MVGFDIMCGMVFDMCKDRVNYGKSERDVRGWKKLTNKREDWRENSIVIESEVWGQSGSCVSEEVSDSTAARSEKREIQGQGYVVRESNL